MYITKERIRGLAVCEGGAYQELKESDIEYTNWSFCDAGLMAFAEALLEEAYSKDIDSINKTLIRIEESLKGPQCLR